MMGCSNPIRILHADCGNGSLVSELAHVFWGRKELAGRFEVFGLKDSHQQSADDASREKIVESLTERHPKIDWISRIRALSSERAWMFPDRFFDFVLSSKVTEPANELGWRFEEQYRVLREFGVGIHCIPDKGKPIFRVIEERFALRYRKPGVIHRYPIPSLPLSPTISSWKRVQQVGERVGFKVGPRYNGALLRRMLSGDLEAYSYPRGSFDTSIARLLGPWLPVTLVFEKPCPD